ncbi:HEAT repeat domain-containing protein [Haloferax namakaokahaiae]|uniref:HEAT repeat domain-containing protein n=1 Tax=Haloferax namakaokahaiae TaxID=1748331 RepID=A0ABD5ZF04_9EURY
MDDSGDPPTIAHLTDLVEKGAHEAASSYLKRYEAAEPAERKRAVQAIRTLADERPTSVSPILPALAPFLTDDERATRLSTTKLFVTVAADDPESVVAHVEPLADRLADEDEFYYVRARSAEALGYVALEDPDAVASPDVLADLRVGLSFDEPEVKVKLAKALEYVAVGNPRRLRHHVSRLADHLDDEDVLVRYHLCTAVAAVGCAYPDTLTAIRDELRERLADENEFVAARAAETLGILRRADESQSPPGEALEPLADSEDSFVRARVRFASAPAEARETDTTPDEVGTIGGIRNTTETVAEKISSPVGDEECPLCGIVLPADGPPMCPRCGAPY